MARFSTCLLLLTTRAAAMGLAAGALHCYMADATSQDRLHTSAPNWSTTALCLQFLLCLMEFVVQLVGMFQDFGPLPRDFQLRFWLTSADTVAALVTWASSSAVLGVSFFLSDERMIDHATFLRLLWHGGLGLACGTVSMFTALLNAVAANEPEPQQEPGAP